MTGYGTGGAATITEAMSALADATALDVLAARLENAGVAVRREIAAVADQRCAAEVISFRDPCAATPADASSGAEPRTAAGDRRQLRAYERRFPLVGCGEAR